MKIIADLHTHTLASGHGIDTARTLCEFAVHRGLKGIAITDHGPGFKGGPDPVYFMALKRMTRGIDLPLRVFYGVEDDIRNRKGDLFLPEHVLKEMEIVLTGIHPFTWIGDQKPSVRTDALINTLGRGLVQVLAHPVGHYRELEIEPVIDAAAAARVALELNGAKLEQLELIIRYLEMCAKNDIFMMVNSDAHVGEEVGDFDTALRLLMEVGYPKHLVVNRSREAIESFLKIQWEGQ
jgi:putative hydrolase